VLPYCILNCLLMVVVELLAIWDVKIAFSPAGHGLMTLIVSFLVISKVNLTYDRYMNARHAMGFAFSALRELNQAALVYTQHVPTCNKLASDWRQMVRQKNYQT
jgi:predicted membrane chloride channel (bestrophin family)